MTIANAEITAEAADDFDPLVNLTRDFFRNPYPAYARLRRRGMYWSKLGFWVATRHADVRFILNDSRFGKDFARRVRASHGETILEEPAFRSFALQMLVRDPPDHGRLRTLMAKAFTLKRLLGYEPVIRKTADELLDAVAPKGTMNVIEDFAYPLPAITICVLLGVPPEGRELLVQGASQSRRLGWPVSMSRQEIDVANDKHVRLESYFRDILKLKERALSDDIISLFIRERQQGNIHSDDELIANILLLFAAGTDTTTNLIGNGLLALGSSPESWRELRDDPATIPQAVEELIRYDSSAQISVRCALEDVSWGGWTIRKEEPVVLLLGAANRDEDLYDCPNELRVRRDNDKPLYFGGGTHFCLGSQLARLEGRIAFERLLARFPDLKVEDVANPNWRGSFNLRGLKSLRASWTAAA